MIPAATPRRVLLVLLGIVVVQGCSALEPRRAPTGTEFVARQYLKRGRAAWAAGNEANARFLIARAVELDPSATAALAEWQSHWPADSLPESAQAALAAGRAAAQAQSARARAAEPSEDGPGAITSDAVLDGAGAAGAPREAPVPGSGVRAGPAAGVSAEPVAITPPAEIEAARARFQTALAGGSRQAVRDTGEELLRLAPFHLPSLYAVLAAQVERRIDPAATEKRVRDLLASLEFGDPAFAMGKPEELSDAAYLRSYRGRFLDLLGWLAYGRGDLAQAEAALRSAETEINLRGRGDVSHLRHLALFYERRGNIAKAEHYAIAAAARDASGSGEIRALASRLWNRRQAGQGLQTRLAAEADRVRREEQSLAVARRLYAPLPVFSAARSDGKVMSDQSVRGKVSVLIVVEPDCEDCRRLLSDLASARPGSASSTRTGRGSVPVEYVALDVSEKGGASGGSRAGASGGGSGVVVARPDRPSALALILEAKRLPLTLVVEPAGFIQYRHVGYPTDAAERRAWQERLQWQVASLSSLAPAPQRPRPLQSGSRRREAAAPR